MVMQELEKAGPSGLTGSRLGTIIAARRVDKQPDSTVTKKSVSGEINRVQQQLYLDEHNAVCRCLRYNLMAVP